MESPTLYPDSPVDQDDISYPCKGCGEILEEGKAFELAGNRWHIDCFRCNTCGTLLDSDANLLLLGDGSLICNKCTYSCSSCNNKIEDLAILTGDQAYCANCFKCRNCKKKIENLRYARTSQGIFCMECHEALMARRRKKTGRGTQSRKPTGAGSLLDKSLPSLPSEPRSAFSPDAETPPELLAQTPTELPPQLPIRVDRGGAGRERRGTSPANGTMPRDGLNVPLMKQRRESSISHRSEEEGGEEFLIPLAFDPTPPAQQSPYVRRERDYFNPAKAADHITPKTADHNTPKAADHSTPKAADHSTPKAADHGTPKTNGTPNSPAHIAYQDRGRVPSDASNKKPKDDNSASGSRAESPQYATAPKESQGRGLGIEDKFKLQEVPKTKKTGGSGRSSNKSTPTSPAVGVLPAFSPHLHDRSEVAGNLTQEPDSFLKASPRPSQESRPREEGSIDSARSVPPSSMSHLHYPPKRGDSLETSKLTQTIPRKEVGSNLSSTRASPRATHGPFSATASAQDSISSGKGRNNSGSTDSPKVRSPTETVAPRKGDRSSGLNGTINKLENLTLDAAQPPRSPDKSTSPNLPRWSGGGEFSLDEDLARILGVENPQTSESFLKRVSNSVRHNRSFSDKGLRVAREQKFPQSPTSTKFPDRTSKTASPTDVDQTTIASDPQTQEEEIAALRMELQLERQRMVEKSRKIKELETQLNTDPAIKSANTELREKRSTMVVLDTQKELVIRELEVLSEHIAAGKESRDPLDVSKLNHDMMRDLAESLRKLKDSFAPEIEDLVQKRRDLIQEVADLQSMKDKSFKEFEQLSMKNAQLAELNNQLVHQIQELYKANVGPPPVATNGLGIYHHHKDKSQISIDTRESRPTVGDPVGSSGTIVAQEEAEPVTILQGPQVVNLRKGQQPKKFNWKKGGQTVAKGVTKGLKGAFSSSQASYSREMQFAETGSYSSTHAAMPPTSDHATAPQPRYGSSDPGRAGFGLFGGTQKYATKMKEPFKPQSNGSSPALVPDATALFGSDLEARAEFEKLAIPYIVTRCIDEVEARGQDVEGIYRKAGGASQIQVLRDGFEASGTQGYDISDPDIDIHAVSSTLKQYFRRLPNPLITYEVYDQLIETATMPNHDDRIEASARALHELPKSHRDTLDYVIRHLNRVAALKEENLMTSLNIAVVFAPTIMRPESLQRELTDTQHKNDAIQFLVENCQAIFSWTPRRIS